MNRILKHSLTAILAFGFGNIFAQQLALSMDEALRLAQENNKQFRATMIDEQTSEEQRKITRSQLLPTVGVNANYMYYFDRQVIFMPGALVDSENEPVVDVAVGGTNAVGAAITLQQPLLAEAQRREARTAGLATSMAKIHTKDEAANLIVKVSVAYLNILLLDETLKLQEQSFSRNVKALEDSKRHLREGKSLKIDTLRNFVAVENLRTSLNHLRSQRSIAIMQLKRNIGITEDASIRLTDSIDSVHLNEGPSQDNDDDEIQRRSDVQYQQLVVQYQRGQLSGARAMRIPTLSLVGAYQLQAQHDHREISHYRWPATSYLGVQAYIPVFSGRRTEARIRQARYNVQKSSLLLDDLKQHASTEVASLQNDLEDLRQRLIISEKTTQAAEINYRIINERYQNGLSSRLELSDAELSLTEARVNRLNTIYHLRVTKLKLDKATGRL
jgi:outer membrane protein